MLNDPQTLTIATVAKQMDRIPSTSAGLTTYIGPDGDLGLQIGHETLKKGASRHLVKLTQKKDITLDGVISESTATVHMVINLPKDGYSGSEISDMTDALIAFCTAGNIERIVRGES